MFNAEPEKFDLSAEIREFVKQKFKERQETIKEAEEQAQQIAQKPATIRSKNEKGKEIIDESGVRELLERARIGLTPLYPNATIAERWGGAFGHLDHIVLYRTHASTEEERLEHESKQLKEYIEGKRLYVVRFAWSNTAEPLRNILDTFEGLEEQPAGFHYSYFDILGDGWTNMIVFQYGFKKQMELSAVAPFGGPSWKDQTTLGKGILEAVKDHSFMSKIEAPELHAAPIHYRPFGGYGGGGG